MLEAANGARAIERWQNAGGKIDLLVTDLVMPEMSGNDLAERLEKSAPGLKVLYMSGYTDDAIVRDGLAARDVDFLPKPFSPQELIRKVLGVQLRS